MARDFAYPFYGPVEADEGPLPVAEVTNLVVPEMDVTEDSSFTIARAEIRDLPGGARVHRVDSIVFIAAIGSAPLDDSVWDFDLFMDRDPKVPGYETWLANATPEGDAVVFTDFAYAVFAGGTRTPDFEVVAYTQFEVTGDALGLEIAEVGLSSLQGRSYGPEEVRHAGAAPVLHPIIETEPPMLVVTMQNIGTTGTAVAGQEVTLLSFVAEVDKGQVALTTLWFSAPTGFQNVHSTELWWDSDGDKTVDTFIAEGDQYGMFLDFVDVHFWVDSDEPQFFSVVATVVDNPNTNVTLALEYDEVFADWDGLQPVDIELLRVPSKRLTFKLK